MTQNNVENRNTVSTVLSGKSKLIHRIKDVQQLDNLFTCYCVLLRKQQAFRDNTNTMTAFISFTFFPFALLARLETTFSALLTLY